MKNLLKILGCLVALVLFTNCGCEEYDPYSTLLTVQNNSDTTIMVYLTNNYPDTIIPSLSKFDASNNHIGVNEHYRRIQSKSQGVIESIKIDRDHYYATNNIFQIFVIKREFCPITNSDVTIDDVYKNNWLLRRYELTRDDLEKMDWTVTFP